MENPLSQKEYGNFIGGEFIPSKSGQTFDVINPATKQVIAKVQRSQAEDIDVAVETAQKAFLGPWGDLTPTERAGYLFKIQKVIEDNAEKLALIESMDNGKTLAETSGADIPLSADHFRYFAAVALTHEDTHVDLPGQHSKITSEALGAVGMIIPWNFPLLMFAWKAAPALAAGNTMVVKIAEQTPLSVLELMSMIQDILPAGVLNIVTGLGEEAGAALASHTGIRKLAFTGSTAVGRLVAVQAAKNGIPCTTELGGKSPVVVMPDADLDEAAKIVVLASTFNQGEVCTCGSRVLVHESIRDQLIPKVVELMKAIVVGNPLDPNSTIGAVASEEQFNKITSYIEHAKSNPEMEILCGLEDVSDEGYFIRPMLVLTSNDSKLAQEEIFGPVLSMITFKDEAEAIQIANDTTYGLGATVISNDLNVVDRMTSKHGIQAGRIWVNQHHTYPSHAPFGGYKDSGIGRETHKMIYDSYTQSKNVLMAR